MNAKEKCMEKKGIPFRQIHLDFHTSPLIGDIGAEFDAEEFADTLKKAHVNSINLFTKCHHGMFYYPTAIGTMHPGLTFDLFGAQMQACREHEIRALAYTCVSWNEDWAARHPEYGGTKSLLTVLIIPGNVSAITTKTTRRS